LKQSVTFFIDFLSELNKSYEKKAERQIPPVRSPPSPVLSPPLTSPPVSPYPFNEVDAHAQPSCDAAGGSSVTETVELDAGEAAEADYGFKMPENFDIPQDYIQLIVPKKSLGKMSLPI
jgi:hypothetical protein